MKKKQSKQLRSYLKKGKRMKMRTKKKAEIPTSLSLCFSLCFLVPEAGIEPAHPKVQDFESSASTSSATRAIWYTNGQQRYCFFQNKK